MKLFSVHYCNNCLAGVSIRFDVFEDLGIESAESVEIDCCKEPWIRRRTMPENKVGLFLQDIRDKATKVESDAED